MIGQAENEMVPQGKKHGVAIAFAKDTGLSSFIHDVERHYSNADVVSFSFDHQTPAWIKAISRKKTFIFNYRYAGVM